MKIDGTNITMIRGDSETFLVYCEDEDGNNIPLLDGDTIYFTIKTSTNAKDKILQKVITEFEDGQATIELLPEDTKNLSSRAYVYDIQLTKQGGEVRTIIEPSRFVIEGDVTHE